MQVVVVPHDPAWESGFLAESPLIRSALGPNVVDIHHIGSTAIRSIVAKPVIDFLVVVEELAAVDRHQFAMQAMGYEAMGECGIAGRRYFRKADEAGRRTHHVHTFARGDAHIARHLAFRDFLNAHPQWARQYGELKTALADLHPHSIDDYIRGKDAFIKHIDQLAAAWIRGCSE